MSTTTVEQRVHPLAGFATRLHTVLDSLADTPAWSMTAAEQRTTLISLTTAQSRLDEVRLRVLAAADRNDIAADTAATSTAAWLAHHTRTPRPLAHAQVKLALRLDTDRSLTRTALAAGALDLAQAQIIVTALDNLPADTTPNAGPDTHPETVTAETHLLDLAAEHDAPTLRLLGRRIHDVIDPDAADRAEGRRLEREEAVAARATYLLIRDNRDGTHTGRFRIPTLHAAALTKALHTFTNPRHRHANPTNSTNTTTGTATTTTGTAATTTGTAATTTGTAATTTGTAAMQIPVTETPDTILRTTRPELLGTALCELLERLPRTLPRAGGLTATVVVHLDYDTLLTGLGTARLDTGEHLSAAAARRLACQAGIIPAVLRHVLDGPSEVLDLGRERRFHTRAQRIALAITQGGCTTDGCDRPPGWCHTHHPTPWSHGGPTSVANGRLLCPFHHTRAHSTDYHLTELPTGKIAFTRRT